MAPTHQYHVARVQSEPTPINLNQHPASHAHRVFMVPTHPNKPATHAQLERTTINLNQTHLHLVKYVQQVFTAPPLLNQPATLVLLVATTTKSNQLLPVPAIYVL